MRRIVAVMVLVTVAFALAACSSGTEAPATTTTTEVKPPPPAAAAAAVPTDKSPKQVVTNAQFPTDPTSVPQTVLDRLKAKQPMLVFFYDSTQIVTDDERAEIDKVVEKYRGLIDLVAYDVQEGQPGAANSADPEIKKAMEMAGKLGVTFQPYILFVDRYGRITGRFSGFVDAQILEREVLRATS
jgi:hypothetical protein